MSKTYKFVKASIETPPEGKLLNMNLLKGGSCLGWYRKYNDTIEVEKYGEIERKDFEIIEWLKELSPSTEMEELKKKIKAQSETIAGNVMYQESLLETNRKLGERIAEIYPSNVDALQKAIEKCDEKLHIYLNLGIGDKHDAVTEIKQFLISLQSKV